MASTTKGDKRRRVRGVFIGIDRYQSPDINELRFAERDARALLAVNGQDDAAIRNSENAARALYCRVTQGRPYAPTR